MSTETKEKDILRGGQFLVKTTDCDDVFTLEDLDEEQKMMRESTIESDLRKKTTPTRKPA